MAGNTIEIKIVADTRQSIAAVGQQAKAVSVLAQNVEVAQVKMRSMAVAFAAGQAAIAGIAEAARGIFVDLPRALLNGAIAAEKMEKAFTALEGSLSVAREQIAFVRNEANRLGIPLAEASDAWLKLAAAARGTALEGEDARRIFSAVAGAASTLGLSAAETSGALLAISQMMSKGTVQAEELRGQLGERIPGAFQIAARAMGVSTSALSDMLDRGELLAADFLPKFAAQLAKEIPASADGTQNAIHRLGNATEEWRRLTGSALAVAIDGFFGLKQAAGELGRDNRIVEWARVSAKAIAALIDVVRELALFVPNVLQTIGGSIAAVARDIQFAFDIASIAVTEGVGRRGREAMKRALDARNAFIDAYNQDMAERWFPKQLTERVDEFFAEFGKQQADGAKNASAYFEAELTKEQQKTIDAIRSNEEKLSAEYRAHANNLYAALTSGALSIDDYNRQRARLEAWYKEQRAKLNKSETLTRLPQLEQSFNAELAALKASLKTAEDVLEASFKARLVKEEAYWQAKGAMQRQALDLEAREIAAKIADQERLIAQLQAVKPKDANQRAEIADRMQQAQNRLAELRVQMDALDGRRMAVDLEVKTNLDRVRQEIDDLKAKLREDIARDTGAMTPELRRAAIAREWRETLAKLAGDAEGEALARRAMDVAAAKADLADLEAAWRLALETMRNAEQSVNIQQQQGLITTADAQSRIAEAHREAAAALDELLPKMEAAAQALGPEAVARVQAWKNELASVKQVTDPIAESLNTSIKSAFEDMFVSIGQGAKTAKDAFLDFARSVIGAIQRIAAQRLAEALFGNLFGGAGGGGGGGIGAFLANLFKGFASGGLVTGPGTSTSDSIPARLSAGEYVVRAAAVRRLGVAFLDAINGLRVPPPVVSGRLAFASGGLVPSVGAGEPPVVVQMTIQTPDASSFRRSQGQIAAEMRLALERARRNL